jgi:hypothetical protein
MWSACRAHLARCSTVDPRGPGGGDVIRLEAVGKTQGEIDVRPRIFAISRPRSDDSGSSDPVVRPRGRDQTIAQGLAVANAEHQASYGRRCGG